MCLWPGCTSTYPSPGELDRHYWFHRNQFNGNAACIREVIDYLDSGHSIQQSSRNTLLESASSNWLSETLDRPTPYPSIISPLDLGLLAAYESMLIYSAIESIFAATPSKYSLESSGLPLFYLTFLSCIVFALAISIFFKLRLLLFILSSLFNDISPVASKIAYPARTPWSRQILPWFLELCKSKAKYRNTVALAPRKLSMVSVFFHYQEFFTTHLPLQRRDKPPRLIRRTHSMFPLLRAINDSVSGTFSFSIAGLPRSSDFSLLLSALRTIVRGCNGQAGKAVRIDRCTKNVCDPLLLGTNSGYRW